MTVPLTCIQEPWRWTFVSGGCNYFHLDSLGFVDESLENGCSWAAEEGPGFSHQVTMLDFDIVASVMVVEYESNLGRNIQRERRERRRIH